MGRDDDIPEVFRRAMEEAGWNRGEGDEGGGRRPPLPRRPQQPFWTNRLFWIGLLLLGILLSFNWIVTTYTEWLWFRSLSYEQVWLRQWLYQVVVFVVAFVVATAVLLGNWHLARRHALRSSAPPQTQLLRLPGMNWVVTGFGLFLGFIFAATLSAQWDDFLRFVYRVEYGTADPVFNNDISFYLFELPVYRMLQEWAFALLFFAVIGVILIHVGNNLMEIQRRRWQPLREPFMRRHLAVLGALLLALWAIRHWLNIYDLLYSERGVVFGATYTDMNASLWALRLQLVLMGLTAVAVALNVLRPTLRPVAVTAGLWLLATVVVGGVYPGLLQRYVVEPNEIERERPYIEHNIQFTRLAFGLDKIEVRPFDVGEDVTLAEVNLQDGLLRNIRLWDYRPLRDTYEQLQALRTYYQFGDIDIDRYNINGEIRQVTLAARELNKANLPAPSWVNQKLEFTHGYGIVMNPVDEVTADGQPQFFLKDLPPQSTVPLEVTRPEIYYGELTNDAVFVGSAREEFSYPSGNENVYSRYEGKGGVLLDSYLKRLAFSLRLGDVNVLLSDEINSETRVQFHRQIRERVQQITPFLALDSDPYLVVWNGRLVWILDGYTISGNFPYATPTDRGLNYIRNAVKITIDAYDGTVNYYISAPEDPIIQAYSRAFPNLFQPLSDMPEELQQHLRYPVDLFNIQTRQYLTYHMKDVRVFYNKEDVWQIPTEIFDQAEQEMEPYYVTMPLPGEETAEFLLIQPLTPANKPNMVAWLAARNDPPYYGELVVYELPKQELVFGPIQIEGRIDQEPDISQQFSLWNQRGSRVIRGNLIVIPINDNFLYVEPVYLLSDTSALPELKRVIVATNSRVVMRTTLAEALTALLEEAPAVDVIVSDVEGNEGTGETAVSVPDTTTLPANQTLAELIAAANEHYIAAEQAQRNGDWATYGQELAALGEILQQMAELTGNTP
ncbi:MAG: UPF0182 family protein [Chloroflexi bacterium]|nr:MAG: UPF0182 family protein [Chloroflexota bacterium]